MSGSDRVRILVARVVEMYELLQALNVAVVKEPLLEVGPGGFGCSTLWRWQCHGGHRHHLHLAVDSWPPLPPTHVRVWAGNQPAPVESLLSQLSLTHTPKNCSSTSV